MRKTAYSLDIRLKEEQANTDNSALEGCADQLEVIGSTICDTGGIFIAVDFLFRALVYLGSALWLLALWFVPVAVDKPQSVSTADQSAELYVSQATKANFGMLKARFYETLADKSRWKIQSEFAELHRREDYTYLKTVIAEFTSMKSGNVIRTRSDYGRSYLSRKVIDMNGDVRITSKQGYLFRMESLNYQGLTRQFTSPDLVKMEGPDPVKPRMKLRGVGLSGSVDDEYFLLKRQVHAERRLGTTQDWLKIDSQQGEFFTGEQRSIFSGRVKAFMPKMTVDCDKLKLLLSGDTEDIEASGNVKILTRGRTAYANTASLVVGGNQILLEGKARVDSKDNQIRGKKILLFTDEDRLEVEEAEGSSDS